MTALDLPLQINNVIVLDMVERGDGCFTFYVQDDHTRVVLFRSFAALGYLMKLAGKHQLHGYYVVARPLKSSA